MLPGCFVARNEHEKLEARDERKVIEVMGRCGSGAALLNTMSALAFDLQSAASLCACMKLQTRPTAKPTHTRHTHTHSNANRVLDRYHVRVVRSIDRTPALRRETSAAEKCAPATKRDTLSKRELGSTNTTCL